MKYCSSCVHSPASLIDTHRRDVLPIENLLQLSTGFLYAEHSCPVCLNCG